jgi:hypothetical protein
MGAAEIDLFMAIFLEDSNAYSGLRWFILR